MKKIILSILMASSLNAGASTSMMGAFDEYLLSVSPANEWLQEVKRVYDTEDKAKHLIDVLRGRSSALTKDEYLLVELLIKSSEMKSKGVTTSSVAAQFRGATLNTEAGKREALNRINMQAIEARQMSEDQIKAANAKYTREWVSGLFDFIKDSSSIIRQSVYLDKLSYDEVSSNSVATLLRDSQLVNNGEYVSKHTDAPVLTLSGTQFQGIFGGVSFDGYYLTRHNSNGYAYIIRNVPFYWCNEIINNVPSTILEMRVDGQLLMDGVSSDRLCKSKSDLLLGTR